LVLSLRLNFQFAVWVSLPTVAAARTVVIIRR